MSPEQEREQPQELSPEELEAQEASELPDREAMTLITAEPSPPVYTLPILGPE